jgi:hypothetical protein
MSFLTGALRKITAQLHLPGGVEAATLTGARTLDGTSAHVQVLDPGGASRNVTLPADGDGLVFLVRNTADAAENLVIKDADGNTIATINRDEWAIVAGDGTTWYALQSSALADYLATSNTWTEAQAINAALTTTRGVSSGTALKVGGLAYSNTAASTAITGETEAETAFDVSYSLPANSLTTGAVLRVVAQGIHTATTGAETHTMALKIGNNTIASKAGIDPANNDLWRFEAEIVCRTAGASGTIVATGTVTVGASGTANPVGFLLGSTVVDTTQAMTIGCYIDRQASANDADSARLDILTVRVEG